MKSRYYAICPHCLDKVFLSAAFMAATTLTCEHCYFVFRVKKLELRREHAEHHRKPYATDPRAEY